MNKISFAIVLLALVLAPGFAQDDVIESGLPDSQKAMLMVDIALADLLENPTIAPFLNKNTLRNMGGPPIEMDEYRNVERVTVLMGAPDFRSGRAEFVAKIKVKDKSTLGGLASKMFGRGREEIPTRKEDGWTVMETRFWPEIVRYRDKTLEFGTPLLTFTPQKALTSPSLAKAIGAMNKEAALRIAFDAQVLAKLLDTVLNSEMAEEEAVYQMVQWGEFINEPSIALYGATILKELYTASLEINPNADTLAKLSLVSASGKENSVQAKAKLLYEFFTFHVNLPIKILKKKENPVAEILHKLADGMKLSTTGPSVELTLQKPKDLSKNFVALMNKMKGSFADRENMNKMKQLALATHNYHDARKRFPFTRDPNEGDRFSDELSWRVRIMPFCELYVEYESMNLIEGWDSETNQAVVGKGNKMFVLSNGSLVCSIKTAREHASFGHILDGTSNTIMLMENRNAAMTPWSKPMDMTLDQATKAVMSLKKGDFLWVGLYDGSVWKLRNPKEKGFTEKDLRNLLNPSDGNVTRTGEILESAKPRLFDGIDRPSRRQKFRDDIEKPDFDAAEAAPEVLTRPPRRAGENIGNAEFKEIKQRIERNK